MKIMLVFGTRPEAIKMCPIIIEMRKHQEIESIVCLTGQHKEMLDQVMDLFGIKADYNLGIMRNCQTLTNITTEILQGMDRILEKEKPNILLVHGDTTSSFAASLVAFYKGIPVGHVEAGLRTYNLKSPFPEEFNRQCVDILADYFFAPTELAFKQLVNEGKNKSKIYVTGNTVIDALQTTVQEGYKDEIISKLGKKRMILMTIHRRENMGEPMYNIFNAMKKIVKEYDDVIVVYPIHKNPKVRKIAEEVFDCNDRVWLIEPLDVSIFHNYIKKSFFIVTDSGGIQEEAPALGKPVLVARDTTERPEGIEAGVLKLIGTQENEVYKNIKILLDDEEEYNRMSKANNPYGDGNASKKIVGILLEEMGRKFI